MATLYENHLTGEDTTALIDHVNDRVAQTFTTDGAYSISSVKLKLYREGAPGTITVSIRTTSSSEPTSTVKATGTTDGDTLTTDTAGEWREITFAAVGELLAATEYAIVVSVPGAENTKEIGVLYDSSTGYADGWLCLSSDAEANWNAGGGPFINYDAVFQNYGGGVIGTNPPVDKTYSKKYIAIADNEFWYQSAADTMSALAAASNDIDTTKPLTIVEAFQKIFVANGTNLKVADFINTKLTVAALDTAPTRGAVVTQSTGATMIVDFVNAAKTEIYGKTTSGTFDTTGTLSGGSMSPEDEVPSAVAQASTTPHWYDWTVYPGGTFGTMTTSAYLVTRYRGRLVLAGDPNLPHMWYMSKVTDPYNWLYSTNPLDAISGNNVNAGEIGDIIRALIAYGDDFLIFGCANSIHILDGDAQHGGSIDEITDKTGMFSFTSWTKDGDGNLFFLGNHGVYKMAGGRKRPVNITKGAIPNFAKDWALDPSTHRVVLAYDGALRGIIIVKTVLATGACSGYFYSLETEGFYPISFANTADGIFCAFDYNADDPTRRKLFLGCADGYVRKLLSTNKNDVHGASGTEPISSYFTVVETLAQDSDRAGKLMSLTVELAGGGAGGAFVDSDGCGYRTYTADDAETVLEKTKALVAWATGIVYAVGDLRTYGGNEYRCIVVHTSDDSGPPFEEPDTNVTDWEPTTFSVGTLSGTGRMARIRDKIRAAWLALKFYNSSASETFGISNIFGSVKDAGKIK